MQQVKNHLLVDIGRRKSSTKKIRFFFPCQQALCMSPKTAVHLFSQTVKEWCWDPPSTYSYIFKKRSGAHSREHDQYLFKKHWESNSYGSRGAPGETSTKYDHYQKDNSLVVHPEYESPVHVLSWQLTPSPTPVGEYTVTLVGDAIKEEN